VKAFLHSRSKACCAGCIDIQAKLRGRAAASAARETWEEAQARVTSSFGGPLTQSDADAQGSAGLHIDVRVFLTLQRGR